MAQTKAMFPNPPEFPDRATASRAQRVFTRHETRNTASMLPYPRFPGISRPPGGQCSARRSHRQHGRLGFCETRDTNHETRLFSFSRNTDFKSVRTTVVARGAHSQEPPAGASKLRKINALRLSASNFFAANCCAQVQMRGTGKCTGLRAVNRCGWTSRRAPFAGKSLQKYAESRFPQENARSATFPAVPVALRARPAAVDANGRTDPAATTETPLIRVDSCPFVVNEPMLRKGNVLYCIDGLFDKRAPVGSRGFRGERRAGWSVRASSSERKSHVPR